VIAHLCPPFSSNPAPARGKKKKRGKRAMGELAKGLGVERHEDKHKKWGKKGARASAPRSL
jgi:hypothetical protein